MDLDKLAFGTAGTALTVSNLDTGTVPVSNLNTNIFVGPDGIAFHRFSALADSLNLTEQIQRRALRFPAACCGTTLNGGPQGAGTAFWMTPDGTNFSAFLSSPMHRTRAIHRASCRFPGAGCFGPQLAAAAAALVWSLRARRTARFSLMRSFPPSRREQATNSDGACPGAVLALSGNTLYGTTAAGGAAANGTIYSLTTNGVTFSVLHHFSVLDSQTGTNADGAVPCGGVILSGDKLFGTASVGGAGGSGVVFSSSTNGGNFSTLHSFTPLDTLAATNADGAMPFGGLVLSGNRLYGTTSAGGQGGRGTIFSIQTNGSGFAVLHHFTATDPVTATNTDGALPGAALLLSSNVLYGTAAAGGSGAAGTVFAFNLSTRNYHHPQLRCCRG